MSNETRLAILRKTGDADVLWLLDHANNLAPSLDAARSREHALAEALERSFADSGYCSFCDGHSHAPDCLVKRALT